jgi:hypothetical protein
MQVLKGLVVAIAILATACSTAGTFVLPQGTTLKIAGRDA